MRRTGFFSLKLQTRMKEVCHVLVKNTVRNGGFLSIWSNAQHN
jgi:hypothetical protein